MVREDGDGLQPASCRPAISLRAEGEPNLLIADERKKFQADEVLEQVKSTLAEALRGAGDGAVLWPPDSRAIQDGTSTFRVVYLGEEWAAWPGDVRLEGVAELVERCGAARREQQNALAFAIPRPRRSTERARQP